ncbi:hypothetical protein [Chromobacterium alticapitis]|uniref:hypothetical protein n=1 Tax=Chromobacterium alticapitis TaxID=2073169 RepID=UPI0011B07A0B|nr:hypothetical protein [Chromobacterium alticapitis]
MKKQPLAAAFLFSLTRIQSLFIHLAIRLIMIRLSQRPAIIAAACLETLLVDGNTAYRPKQDARAGDLSGLARPENFTVR